MLQAVFPFIGGLGLFLIGMMLLSNGLVAFAGGSLQKALIRFTGTPAKAFASGAVVTALAQSSTATTVTLIGFVSAGLITFAQAIGVVIGASLGNTATGWIVATLGLKVNLGFYTLPFIGIGALAKLLSKGRWADLGLALAGFGMLFLGLNTLQDGMRGLSDVFNLANLPASGFSAHFLIMAIGLALTAVLQSSTAAIAMALTALHTGNINFDQAAALVVGSSIGTTLTGALVAIGGTIHAKRTALAYVLFNLVAGLIAILLLPLFLSFIRWLEEHALLTPGAISLAAFHSLFIGVGVALFLPVSAPFSRLVKRLLPERGDDMSQHLDDSLLGIPSVSLEASQRTLERAFEKLLAMYRQVLLMQPPERMASELVQVRQALERAFDFVTRIQLPPQNDALSEQRIAQLHAVDHLLRFRNRLYDMGQAEIDFTNPAYTAMLESSLDMVNLARESLAQGDLCAALEGLEHDADALASASRQGRHELLQDRPAGGSSNTITALGMTDTFRSLERNGLHIWRISHYLAEGRPADAVLVDDSTVSDSDSTDSDTSTAEDQSAVADQNPSSESGPEQRDDSPAEVPAGPLPTSG